MVASLRGKCVGLRRCCSLAENVDGTRRVWGRRGEGRSRALVANMSVGGTVAP